MERATYLARLGRIERQGDDAEAILEDSRSLLTPDRVERARDRARALIEAERGEPLTGQLLADLDQVFVAQGGEALALLKEQGDGAQLTDAQAGAAEAIIETDGSRPTLRLADDGTLVGLDEDRTQLGQWDEETKQFAAEIATVARSVGRIDLDGRHKGTGWVITDNLILTNRHVLQALADQDDDGRWQFKGSATITFDAEPDESRTQSFALSPTVVAAGDSPIPTTMLDFALFDFAVLECGSPDGLPPALSLESDADKLFVDRPVYTVGYPARPGTGSYESEVLERLFAHRYGVKRFAPGLIDQKLGGQFGDSERISVGHDATTLGGSSGCCVVDLQNDGHLVAGLHFGGGRGFRNWAHSTARLAESLDGIDIQWREF